MGSHYRTAESRPPTKTLTLINADLNELPLMEREGKPKSKAHRSAEKRRAAEPQPKLFLPRINAEKRGATPVPLISTDTIDLNAV